MRVSDDAKTGHRRRGQGSGQPRRGRDPPGPTLGAAPVAANSQQGERTARDVSWVTLRRPEGNGRLSVKCDYAVCFRVHLDVLRLGMAERLIVGFFGARSS